MIKFEKIKPGMTLWDVRKASGLSAMIRHRYDCWPVYVKSVNEAERMVLASWNGNKATWIDP